MIIKIKSELAYANMLSMNETFNIITETDSFYVSLETMKKTNLLNEFIKQIPGLRFGTTIYLEISDDILMYLKLMAE